MKARLAVAIVATALSCHVAEASERHETVTAIWHVRQVTLVYFDEYTSYTCPELVHRVTSILSVLGAHPATGTEARCQDAGKQMLSIELVHPVEATPQNLKAAAEFDAVEQLLAHVRHERLPGEADLERFPAAWRSVSLTRLPYAKLGKADCALLRTMKAQIFPLLDIRVPKNGFQCTPGVTTIHPRFVAEALIPESG